jgi:hypothetical protein
MNSAPQERPTWDANTPIVLRLADGLVGDNIQNVLLRG